MSTKPDTARTRDLQKSSLQASYQVLSLAFTVRSPSPAIAAAVQHVYGEMRCSSAVDPGLRVLIEPSPNDPGLLRVLFDGAPVFEASRLGDLLHNLDNQLTVLIEQALPQYYFVHAAALADAGRVTLLIGPSGAGKSTTAYGLAAAGAEYLSDELAPVRPSTGEVCPYPRALCLKRDPPAPLALPEGTLRTEWTLHVRPAGLTKVAANPLPLSRIVFVRYDPAHSHALLRPVSRAEATVRLYQSALNQLAHPSMGLDDTIGLVRKAECFELLAAGIEETVGVLREAR